VKTEENRTMTDLTSSFAALASEAAMKPEIDLPAKDKKRILRKAAAATKDTFEPRARDVAKAVASLGQFLSDTKADYMQSILSAAREELMGDSSAAEEANLRREKRDASANTYINTCQGLVKQFKADLVASAFELADSRKTHLEGVVNILERQLKDVCTSFAEQQAIRVRKELEVQRFARLHSRTRKSMPDSTSTGTVHVVLQEVRVKTCWPNENA